MAFKVSRAAVEAAAKAAGLDLRKVTPSQYRTLCAAAAAEVTPTAAGISAKGTVGAGAGLAAAGISAKGTVGAGAGLAAAGISAKGTVGAGAGLAAAGISAKGTVGAGAGLAAAGISAKGTVGAGAGLAAAKGTVGAGAGLAAAKGTVGAGAGLAAAKGTVGAGAGLVAAKGTVGAGAGLAAAGVGLGTKGAAGTDLGANAIPMCECFGSPAVSLYGAKATGAAGIRGGVRVGAPAAGGHGRDLASNAISGLRAGMCTATADGCGQCSKLEAEAHSLNYSLQRHSSQLWRMNIALVNEVDRLQKKMSGMKSDNIRNTMGIMATGIGAFLAVGAFFATDVQEAWMGETLAEMDRRAAARISGGDGGAPGARAKQVGAAAAPPGNGNAPAKATATATVNK